MPTRDLAQKYPGNTRNAINKAIRTELVGGDHCLTALDALKCLEHDWIERRWTDHLGEIRAAIQATERVASSMRAEIRRRYGMPPERE